MGQFSAHCNLTSNFDHHCPPTFCRNGLLLRSSRTPGFCTHDQSHGPGLRRLFRRSAQLSRWRRPHPSGPRQQLRMGEVPRFSATGQRSSQNDSEDSLTHASTGNAFADARHLFFLLRIQRCSGESQLQPGHAVSVRAGHRMLGSRNLPSRHLLRLPSSIRRR